jgi:hypothetical protein
MGELLERNTLELQSEIAQAGAATAEVDRRMTEMEERLRLAENQAAERKADVRGLRETMVGPLVMTWIVTAAAAAIVVVGGFVAMRARRARKQGRSTTRTVTKE